MNTDTAISRLPGLLLRLWQHLSRRRKRQFFLVLGLMLASAFAEVISLGAVLPFLAAITAPDKLLSHPLMADLVKAWGITSPDQLALPLTIAFATAALVAAGIRMLLLWATTRLSFAAGADLSVEVYRRTLYQPYRVHVSRNSSELISGISGKVGGVVFGGFLPVLMLVSSIILLLTILSALMAIDAVVATVAITGFGGSYLLITWFSRKRLEHNGQRIAIEQTRVIKVLQEGLGGIRDVLLDGTQPVYCNIYSQADQPLRRAQGDNQFIAAAPRFAMEAIVMILIAALAYALSREEGAINSALPVLGALALGAQRLLPALQQAYGAWANIVGSRASLADALDLLDQPLPPEANQPVPMPLTFHDSIQFKDVCFRYGNNDPWVLVGFNLTIAKGARVGFVGSTGGGKSTTLDLLMGLLEPTDGQILVDGMTLSGERRRAWQQTIAHVPQYIYLADTTLAENIAFGLPQESINLERVRQAARQAQIAEFIESRPEGYQALGGERGIRLSGGQRQRIGIARALYKRASILVFDEATSALDNATEQTVMDAIDDLASDLTILLIAHRLSTVRHCDIIVELEHGRVVAQGSYDQLLKSSWSFQKLARVAESSSEDIFEGTQKKWSPNV